MKTETYQWMDDDTWRAHSVSVGLSRDDGEINGVALLMDREPLPGFPGMQMSAVLDAEEIDDIMDALDTCRKIVRGEIPLPEMPG